MRPRSRELAPGEVFGRLTFREYVRVERDRTHRYAICDCTCGVKGYVVRVERLLNGDATSHGCFRSEASRRTITIHRRAIEEARRARLSASSRTPRARTGAQ